MKKRESWGSKLGLIMAAAGLAVGFGNFLRFPLQAIQNGGGAFMIPYIVCFLLMGLPMLLLEWAMGRYGGKYGFHSTPFMMQTFSKNPIWKYIGTLGIFINIVIAAYYTYLESWTLGYIFHSLKGTFTGMSTDETVRFFDDYINFSGAIPYEALFFYLLCLALNVYLLIRGLRGGVEKVATWGMPILILFGLCLAFAAVTLKQGTYHAINDGVVGLNFLWTPDYSSILNPKVWLAAAGQIFFTLGLGWGTVQCYAAFIHDDDDIALSSMTTGFTNEFVEVIVGGALIIPLSVGFLGFDKVMELVQLGGLALGFKTMPYLFSQWGVFGSAVAGFMWFFLLFIAGITSSLGMGLPFVNFVQDEFHWSKRKASIVYGLLTFLLGLPTIFFFNQGVFDEYDYWGGTVAIFIFGTLEVVLFVWIFGMKKGWAEITRGAHIKIPSVFKFALQYITPIMLLLILIGSFFTPQGNDWGAAIQSLFSGNGWGFDNGSVVKQFFNAGLHNELLNTTDEAQRTLIQQRIWISNATKILLLLVFIALCVMVYYADKKRKKNPTI